MAWSGAAGRGVDGARYADVLERSIIIRGLACDRGGEVSRYLGLLSEGGLGFGGWSIISHDLLGGAMGECVASLLSE